MLLKGAVTQLDIAQYLNSFIIEFKYVAQGASESLSDIFLLGWSHAYFWQRTQCHVSL